MKEYLREKISSGDLGSFIRGNSIPLERVRPEIEGLIKLLEVNKSFKNLRLFLSVALRFEDRVSLRVILSGLSVVLAKSMEGGGHGSR